MGLGLGLRVRTQQVECFPFVDSGLGVRLLLLLLGVVGPDQRGLGNSPCLLE